MAYGVAARNGTDTAYGAPPCAGVSSTEIAFRTRMRQRSDSAGDSFPRVLNAKYPPHLTLYHDGLPRLRFTVWRIVGLRVEEGGRSVVVNAVSSTDIGYAATIMLAMLPSCWLCCYHHVGYAATIMLAMLLPSRPGCAASRPRPVLT
eukprot:3372777-Rhodomonas_salina.2